MPADADFDMQIDHQLVAWKMPLLAPLASLQHQIHTDNIIAGWWQSTEGNKLNFFDIGGELLGYVIGTKLILIVSELAEGADGEDDSLMDDKLPHRKMLEVELADAAIRIYDTASGAGVDLAATIRSIILLGDGRIPFILGNGESLADRTVHEDLWAITRHVAAAMEGHRKGKPHGNITNCSALAVHLAYALIGCYVLAAECGFDMEASIREKRAFNKQRADHKPENRQVVGGKKF